MNNIKCLLFLLVSLCLASCNCFHTTDREDLAFQYKQNVSCTAPNHAYYLGSDYRYDYFDLYGSRYKVPMPQNTIVPKERFPAFAKAQGKRIAMGYAGEDFSKITKSVSPGTLCHSRVQSFPFDGMTKHPRAHQFTTHGNYVHLMNPVE